VFDFESGTMPEGMSTVFWVRGGDYLPRNKSQLTGNIGKKCSFQYEFADKGKGCTYIKIISDINFD